MTGHNFNEFAKMPTEMILDDRLTKTDLRVWGLIATYCIYKRATAWPGLRTLANGLNIKKQNVCRATKRLQDFGYLVKIFPGGGKTYTGRGRSTTYAIPLAVINNDNETDQNQLDIEDAIKAQAVINADNGGDQNSPKKARSVIRNDNAALSVQRPKKNNLKLPSPLPPPEGDTGGAGAPSLDCVVAAVAANADGADAPTQSVAAASAADGLHGGVSAEDSNIRYSKSQAHANAKIAEWINAVDPKSHGWDIVGYANDPESEKHDQAVDWCKQIAEAQHLGWTPPKKQEIAS